MDDNSFGARLAAARRAAGYNQTEVAKYITEAGFPVRTQAVSKWERGTTLPSARQLVELCRLYHIQNGKDGENDAHYGYRRSYTRHEGERKEVATHRHTGVANGSYHRYKEPNKHCCEREVYPSILHNKQ